MSLRAARRAWGARLAGLGPQPEAFRAGKPAASCCAAEQHGASTSQPGCARGALDTAQSMPSGCSFHSRPTLHTALIRRPFSAGPTDDRLPGGNRDAPAIGDDKPREDEPRYSETPEDNYDEDEDNDSNIEADGRYDGTDNMGGHAARVGDVLDSLEEFDDTEDKGVEAYTPPAGDMQAKSQVESMIWHLNRQLGEIRSQGRGKGKASKVEAKDQAAFEDEDEVDPEDEDEVDSEDEDEVDNEDDDPEYTKAMLKFQGGFEIQTINVNRSSKGTRSGGIARFSAMLIVGNYKGFLGLGVGRSAEMADAVTKAHAQAMKTLFFVPRYREQTLHHPVQAKYGQVKVIAYPRSSGTGMVASHLMRSICALAGLRDVGVKVHGPRNVRNAVKALIRAFESQTTAEEVAESQGVRLRELAGGARFLRRSQDRITNLQGMYYQTERQKRPKKRPHAKELTVGH